MLTLARLERLPLFSCPFRSMFLATALWAAIGIALSGAAFSLGFTLPAAAGGALAWHAHELMFGVGLAAIAGFVLTAVPEFTDTPPLSTRVSLAIALAWLAARVAFWLAPVIGPWPAAAAEVGFAVALPALLGARLLRDPQRRHRGFFWGLAAFAVVTAGFWFDVLRGEWPMRWVHAALDAMMILVVVAMSRISMRIVNDALDARRARAADGDDELPEYRARPPRRNLAIVVIALHALAALVAPESPVTGWVALAAGAALLNLMNDWHVGRALFGRWASMLYAVYWTMALGYVWIGAALLGLPIAPSGGTHLLTIGGMGLSIYAVLNIAGRMHAGRPLDERRWTPIGVALLVAAAAMRAAAGVAGAPADALIALSSLAWVAAWTLVLVHLGPAWWGERMDGGSGCEEWVDPALRGAPAPRCDPMMPGLEAQR
ncbi:MAG: NnrS family protein [Burkholderiales bacterium]|nr:MAG: NnrS family protein [Burkholderiales bacterium]